MAKRTLKVGDEFRKDLCVVRVTTLENPGRYPVRYQWITLADGASTEGLDRVPSGINSKSGTFKFFEGEGFTHHPVQVAL
jgi:hypothetical protein